MKNAVSAPHVLPQIRERKPNAVKPLSAIFSDAFIAGALLIIALIVLSAIVPQWLAPYTPTEMQPDLILRPPGASHWLGTDYFGRDVLSLIIYGSQDSLLIGVVSVLAAGLVGGAVGALAGYVGGIVDVIAMRLIDVLMTLPAVLLSLAIAAALGPSLTNIVLAVGISNIPKFARVMRSQVLAVKSRPYIAASRSIGTPNWLIFFKHVLPNAWSPLLVIGTVSIGTSCLLGSGLSFLGLGVLKDIPDWGTLLAQGRGYLTVAWWIATFPGLALTLFVLSVNVLGDRLQDALDPKRSRI